MMGKQGVLRCKYECHYLFKCCERQCEVQGTYCSVGRDLFPIEHGPSPQVGSITAPTRLWTVRYEQLSREVPVGEMGGRLGLAVAFCASSRTCLKKRSPSLATLSSAFRNSKTAPL